MTNESNEIQNPENPENMVSPKEAVKTTSAAAAHDDFDWDADEAGFESYSVTDRKQLSSTRKPSILLKKNKWLKATL